MNCVMEFGNNEAAAGPVQAAKKPEFNPYQDNGGYAYYLTFLY
jgi:hypothetical protein